MKLRAAIDQCIDGIAIADLEPRLTYVNAAFAEMHRHSREDMAAMGVGELHNEDQMNEFTTALQHVKQTGSWQGKIGHIKKDRTVFHIHVSATLSKDQTGTPTAIIAVARPAHRPRAKSRGGFPTLGSS